MMIFCSRGNFHLFTLKFSFGLSLLLISSVIFAQSSADSSSACGPLRPPGQYGPYDYRTDQDKLPIVLGAHFTPEVETLIRGKTGTRPGGDIDYTLRAIPNNHRALIAMMRLGEKEKTLQPRGSRYTIECWFERAILFRPDDTTVRMIYSTYLNSKRRIPEANAQLEMATIHAKNRAFTHYNIGLHYLDLINYDKALAQAHKAMALGWTQTDLRDQLQRVGQWTEPAEFSTTPAAENVPTEQAK